MKPFLYVSSLCALLVFPVYSAGASNLSVWNLLGDHIDIGLHKQISSVSSSADILAHQQALQSQSAYDLLMVLDVAQNESTRRLVLNAYLADSEALLRGSPSFLWTEEALLAEYAQNIQECEQPISQYNADFSMAVKASAYQSAHALSQKIAHLRACIAENTVYYKEHLLYRDFLVASQSVLQRKHDYLLQNKEKIVMYYQLMKPELLKELYDISLTLRDNYSV